MAASHSRGSGRSIAGRATGEPERVAVAVGELLVAEVAHPDLGQRPPRPARLEPDRDAERVAGAARRAQLDRALAPGARRARSRGTAPPARTGRPADPRSRPSKAERHDRASSGGGECRPREESRSQEPTARRLPQTRSSQSASTASAALRRPARPRDGHGERGHVERRPPQLVEGRLEAQRLRIGRHERGDGVGGPARARLRHARDHPREGVAAPRREGEAAPEARGDRDSRSPLPRAAARTR